MALWKKMAIAAGLVMALFIAVVGFALPEIARRTAIAWVADNTARTLAIDDISFNPLNGQLTVRGCRLSEPDSPETFSSFERLLVNVDISSVWRRAFIVDRLQLVQPYANIVRVEERTFNFSDLLAPTDGEKPETEEETAPARFALNNVLVRGGSLDFRDLDKPDVVHTVRRFDLDLPFLGNTPALADRFVQPRLSLVVDDASFQVEGEAKPFADSLETSLSINLDNIDLPVYTAYLPRERPVEIASGKLAVDLDLAYKVSPDLGAQLLLGGDLVLTGVSVLDRAGEKVFFLPLAQAVVEWADLLSRRAVIEEVAIYGLEVFVSRDADGEWNHARLARDPALSGDTGHDEGDEKESAAGPTPHIELEDVRLRNGLVHLRDESGTKPFVREIRDIDIDLSGFDSLAMNPMPLQVQMRAVDPVRTGFGDLTLTGEIDLEPVRLSAAVTIDRVQLAGLDSYFPPRFTGILANGYLDADLKMELAVDVDVTFGLSGRTGVRALQLIEPIGRSDVLNWESLQLDGIDMQLAAGPPVIRISELALNSFLAKILVTPDGRVNLQQMVNASAHPEPEPVRETDQGRDEATPPAVVIDRVTLQGGTVAFTDRHIPDTFNAMFLNLGGRVTGLDSRAGRPATVDLRGNLENRSPLTITGAVNPLGEFLFADLEIRFEAIELSPMTPYSGNYLGYAIEKGKLYLNLDYEIDGGRLDAANHVFLDQFTFGRRVESEEATSLPVRLAVALLKDGRGEIHLDLPVSGRLDDPEFSVVGVVFTILKNLLVKAATSPFKLLAAVVGGGDDDFSVIAFPPGESNLGEGEKEKLARLADALRQRPALKLEISGYIDPERDPEAWRRTRLERALRQRKYVDLKQQGELPAGTAADDLAIDATERPRYLEEVYRAADFPKPRTAFGTIKTLPDAEMEKLILANTAAGEEEMRALADQRARVVYEHLVQVRNLPVERVFLKQDDIDKAPDDTSVAGSRVGFGVAVE